MGFFHRLSALSWLYLLALRDDLINDSSNTSKSQRYYLETHSHSQIMDDAIDSCLQLRRGIVAMLRCGIFTLIARLQKK
jgi:hypothetical protein